MCGIIGIVDPARRVSPELIDSLRGLIAHRGPDGGATVVRQSPSFSIGLGAQRLSILDLSSAGMMPMANEDGSVWIAYNGELYNHAELRSELEGRGRRYRSRTDTETVIHAYEEFGTECFARFNGMFACLVYDERRDRVVVARDRMGIKPLYYGEVNGAFAFASELKALCHGDLLPFEIDPVALDIYLALGYVPAPYCLVAGAKKLEAGTFGIYEAGRFRTERFWRAANRGYEWPRRSWGETVEATRATVSEAVRRQMMSDVPVGVLLSGGLDSSIVASVARACSSGPMHTFSVGFETGHAGVDRSYNTDRQHAREVADRIGVTHHDVIVRDPATLEPHLRRLLVQLDEPVWELSFLSIYFMSELAREHGVKVLLTGDGSDEIFGGYPWHPALRRLQAVERLPGLQPFFQLAARMPIAAAHAAKLDDLRRKYRKSDSVKYLAQYGIFSAETRAQAFSRSEREDPVLAVLSPLFGEAQSMSLVTRFARAELELWVGNHFNQRVDRMTMAASVEGRVPFQDNAVIDLALAMPFEEKLRGGVGKAPLRAAFADVLPTSVISRPKMPFATPAGTWIQGPLLPLVLRMMTQETWAAFPGLDRPTAHYIHQAISSDLRVAPATHQRLLALTGLVLWAQEFSKRSAPIAPSSSVTTTTVGVPA